MSDRMDIERAGYPGPDGPAPISPKYSTDPRLNAALEADARKLEAMGGDPGITLDDVAPLSPIALDWDKVKQEAIAAFCLRFSCDPSDIKKHENPLFEVGVWLKPEIDAQLRALVARVAQEEREKVLAELSALFRNKMVKLLKDSKEQGESPPDLSHGLWAAGVIDNLRGTP